MRLLSYILRALCAVAVGFLLVSNPSTMADLLIQVVGGLFGLLGLGTIVGYFTSRRQSPSGSALRPVFPFAGLGSLAFGAILIVWPTQFKEIFKNKKNYYRKYRDMSILAFAVVYAIAVIDAYVDAELSTFDISPDLSLEWAPAIVTTNPARCGAQPVAQPSSDRGFGVALRLNF